MDRALCFRRKKVSHHKEVDLSLLPPFLWVWRFTKRLHVDGVRLVVMGCRSVALAVASGPAAHPGRQDNEFQVMLNLLGY
ncbi:hypothetical protein [Variovorax sp. RKNM96]|uniref:hypothetical protein n=1 Tax=Variovorax sp. RKNM96 TaxID=2681552 RepID=UPI00197E6C66|nr:hypothetical protein [Variovorax sp. RKNM96]